MKILKTVRLLINVLFLKLNFSLNFSLNSSSNSSMKITKRSLIHQIWCLNQWEIKQKLRKMQWRYCLHKKNINNEMWKIKKKTIFVNKMILLIKILEWKEFVRKSELLTLLFLTKLNLNLYTDSDIWFKLARDFKIYCFSVMQQQEININSIQISKTYQKTMKSSQKDEWIMTMKIKIHDIKRKKIYSLIK